MNMGKIMIYKTRNCGMMMALEIGRLMPYNLCHYSREIFVGGVRYMLGNLMWTVEDLLRSFTSPQISNQPEQWIYRWNWIWINVPVSSMLLILGLVTTSRPYVVSWNTEFSLSLKRVHQVSSPNTKMAILMQLVPDKFDIESRIGNNMA